MKKIILGLLVISSFVFSYDKWKNELVMEEGIFNKFSNETEKYFCESQNKEELAKEILEFFKKQNKEFYENHKYAVENLPMQLIKSTEKSNFKCPQKGYIVTGSCGDWKCTKEVEESTSKFIREITEEDHKIVDNLNKQ